MKYRIYILSLTLAVLMASCAKDRRQDCYCELDLYFSYHGDGTTQIFNKKISDVDIYIFNESYGLVRQEKYDQIALAQKQGGTLALSPGTFHLLCVGNFSNETRISDISSVSSLSSIYYEHPQALTGVIPTCGSLFSSMKTVVIPDTNRGPRQETMEFEPLCVQIRMEVTGLDVSENWSFQVRGAAGRIYNDLTFGLDVTVIPETTFAPADHMLHSTFNIFRQPDRNLIFDFINPAGETMCSVNLFDFLARYPNIDLSKKEVYIPIRLQIMKDEIGVTISEWGIIPIAPEW